MRIRYQSFIDPEEDPQYTSLLQSYLDSLAGPDVTYEVVGMVPPDKKLHRISEYRCGAHVIRGAVRARDDGFDAYAIGHFQDGGLGEARSAVDLPVTGLGEASLLFGCSLGRRIGLITINPLFIPWHEEQVAAYGLRERVGAVRTLQTTPSIYMDACTDDAALGQLLSDFKVEAARCAELGCDVVIPAGGLIATLFSRLPEPVDLGGPAYVSCVGALAKHTEMAVSCHRLGIGRTGRTGAYRLASQEVLDEFVSSMAH
jgi:Asp/Glu/hydantoin racemase